MKEEERSMWGNYRGIGRILLQAISSIAFQYYQAIKFEGNKYKKPQCVTLKNLEKGWEAIESF